MNELLKIILSLSLSGALLILLLLLCKPLVKGKLSKRWQYYIWLIVVARLLLPFAPETNLMGMIFRPQPEQASTSFTDAGSTNQLNVPGQVDLGGFKQPEPDRLTDTGISEILYEKITVICLLVWFVVAIGLLIRKITVYQSFVKYMRAGRIEISDMQLWERLGILVAQLGIKGSVGLYTNNLISSPLLIGFFRPCIMLPTAGLSESDFDNTILHELTHYRRRDMFYKWLVQVTICLHWFNPFVYLMDREVSRACELSCDEAVIKMRDAGGRRAYGDTLLNAMGMGGNYKDSLASITLNESKELLKERLDAIMNYRNATRMSATISLALVFTFSFAAVAVGAYAVNPSVATKGNVTNLPKQDARIMSKALNTEQGLAPLHIDNCEIQYDDSPYHWPSNAVSFTNTGDKAVMDYEIVCLAYDKNGNPLELYWDALNVAANGEIGSVGFGTDGVDYGIVTGISAVSPKAYSHTYRKMQKQPPEDLIRTFEKEYGSAWVENWLQEWKQGEEKSARANALAPGQSKQVAWNLFDGWKQSTGEHDASYIMACVRQVTYDDGGIWVNPAYDNWIKEYHGKSVSVGILESYYN